MEETLGDSLLLCSVCVRIAFHLSRFVFSGKPPTERSAPPSHGRQKRKRLQKRRSFTADLERKSKVMHLRKQARSLRSSPQSARSKNSVDRDSNRLKEAASFHHPVISPIDRLCWNSKNAIISFFLSFFRLGPQRRGCCDGEPLSVVLKLTACVHPRMLLKAVACKT